MTWVLILILCAFSIPVKAATFSGIVSKIEEQMGPSTTNDTVAATPKVQETSRFQFSDLTNLIRRANTTIITKMLGKLLEPGNVLCICTKIVLINIVLLQNTWAAKWVLLSNKLIFLNK